MDILIENGKRERSTYMNYFLINSTNWTCKRSHLKKKKKLHEGLMGRNNFFLLKTKNITSTSRSL